MQNPTLLTFAVALGLTTGVRAASSTYAFTMDQSGSGLIAEVDITIDAEGHLIGNYDQAANPTGTRTKPGFVGSFGSTENVAVPTEFVPTITGSPTTSASGTFTVVLDPEAGAVTIGGYAANLLAGGPAVLDTNVTVTFGSFRTRTPDSTYFGASLPISLGEATLDVLTATQVGDPVPGTLTPDGPDTYTVTGAIPVELNGSGGFLGDTIELTPTPAVLAFQGTLTLSGATASLNGSQPFVLENSGPPTPEGPAALPPIPFDVPTIIPPGSTAHLVANLTVTNVAASVTGTLTTSANGVRVVVVETGACCRNGGCDEALPADCAPFVCDVADHLPASFTGCYGDADGNGTVNAGDRGFVAVNIGATDAALVCQFDMDGNGFVNAGDRGFVAVNIGLCTELPDYMDGSGLNGGAADTRFGAAEFLGVGSTCAEGDCP